VDGPLDLKSDLGGKGAALFCSGCPTSVAGAQSSLAAVALTQSRSAVLGSFLAPRGNQYFNSVGCGYEVRLCTSCASGSTVAGWGSATALRMEQRSEP